MWDGEYYEIQSCLRKEKGLKKLQKKFYTVNKNKDLTKKQKNLTLIFLKKNVLSP